MLAAAHLDHLRHTLAWYHHAVSYSVCTTYITVHFPAEKAAANTDGTLFHKLQLLYRDISVELRA